MAQSLGTRSSSVARKRIGVCVAGGSGYGAGELVRLLLQHPDAEVAAVTTTSRVGEPISSIHTHLRGLTDCVFAREIPFDRLGDYDESVLVTALPHGTSAPFIESLSSRLEATGTRVVDLSGDLRLRDETLHSAHYPDVPYSKAFRGQFVYGLPELNREALKSARFVTNPGCLATASALALLPLAGLTVVGSVVLDAKTGTSGAGRTAQASMHHPTRHGNMAAYKVLQHRHEAEIFEVLRSAPRGPETFAEESGASRLQFVPHLLPVSRGIFVTAYATLTGESTQEDLHSRYQDFYASAPFVRVVEGSPTLHDIVGSNFCDIAVHLRGRQVVVLATLDNLVKGMVGQAIQNINLMCGLEETLGLRAPGFVTV